MAKELMSALGNQSGEVAGESPVGTFQRIKLCGRHGSRDLDRSPGALLSISALTSCKRDGASGMPVEARLVIA